MSKINDGGPAFPNDAYDPEWTKQTLRAGMSLRDWFAGQALAGMLARADQFTNVAAERAYKMADALLAERAKAEGRS